MSRAQAVIADAVAAVIAAAITAHLNREASRVTPEEAHQAARAAVAALARDGWHITARPDTPRGNRS